MIRDILQQLAAKIPAGETHLPKVEAENLVPGVLNTVYFAAGITAVLALIIAGILYMVADGDSSKIKRAKEAILYAIIGLVVVMSAFIITRTIIGRF